MPRYGYYADVANECQLFHVCYPVLYPDGQQEMIKWSFVCPNQTIFDQVTAVTDQYSAAHTLFHSTPTRGSTPGWVGTTLIGHYRSINILKYRPKQMCIQMN